GRGGSERRARRGHARGRAADPRDAHELPGDGDAVLTRTCRGARAVATWGSTMRLAEYTDYTLRVLMYCASNPDRLVTIAEIADSHGVSKNNLMKIVNDLARQGVLETTRGRGGGIRLLQPASEIRVGDVVRWAETDFR